MKISSRARQEEYWSEKNRLWASSGLSQKKFCKQEVLSYRQFVYWRSILNEQSEVCSKPKLLKVSARSAVNFCENKSIESVLEVFLTTGIKVHIRTESDVAMAGALIKLLGGA